MENEWKRNGKIPFIFAKGSDSNNEIHYFWIFVYSDNYIYMYKICPIVNTFHYSMTHN